MVAGFIKSKTGGEIIFFDRSIYLTYFNSQGGWHSAKKPRRSQYQDWYSSVFEGKAKLNVPKFKEIGTVLLVRKVLIGGHVITHPPSKLNSI